MEGSKDTKTGFACPFCGAPQRDVVPSDAAQMKCNYCGGMFSVLAHFKDIAPRCPNHPEIFAKSLCNDCSEHFCSRCLHSYNLKTDRGSARLYLCPECFRKRLFKQANSYIWSGFVLLFVGFFFFAFVPVEGLLLLLFSIPMILYGFDKRSRLLKTPSAYNERETILTRESKVSEFADDIDDLYGKMLSKDMMRFGAINAKELLDNEIYAHIRQGLDYGEAVRKVARARGIRKAEIEKEAESRETSKPKKVR